MKIQYEIWFKIVSITFRYRPMASFSQFDFLQWFSTVLRNRKTYAEISLEWYRNESYPNKFVNRRSALVQWEDLRSQHCRASNGIYVPRIGWKIECNIIWCCFFCDLCKTYSIRSAMAAQVFRIELSVCSGSISLSVLSMYKWSIPLRVNRIKCSFAWMLLYSVKSPVYRIWWPSLLPSVRK